jgi:TonB family protein
MTRFCIGVTILKNMRVKLTILLLSILAGSAASRAQGAEATSAQNAETTLKQFEGKTLILRHPLQSDSQRYDAEGKVLRGGKEGSWAVFGGILIDHVTLAPDKLRLEGRRIFFLFPKQKLVLFEFTRRKHHGSPPFSPLLTVEIILDKPIDSGEQALSVVNRVFALKTEDFLESLPDYWRIYLADHHFSYDASQKRDAEYRWREEVESKNKPAQNVQSDMTKDSTNQDSHEPVSYPADPGSGVKAPKPKFTPEPAFSDLAKYEDYQGIVIVNVIVGSDGTIQRIRLVRPLGMGLDENAQSTLHTWRFQPATRNGQPVAVEMNIEIAFNSF